jgi:hypothetical protein
LSTSTDSAFYIRASGEPAGCRRRACDLASNLIVLNPVRRYQWGGASIEKRRADRRSVVYLLVGL